MRWWLPALAVVGTACGARTELWTLGHSSAPLTGCPQTGPGGTLLLTDVVGPASSPGGIVIVGSRVIWTAQNQVNQVDLTTCELSTLAPNESGGPATIVTDGTTLFWPADGIRDLALAGGVPQTVDAAGGGVNLALDADSLYYVRLSTVTFAENVVVRVPKQGGPEVELGGGTSISRIAVDDTSVYWNDDHDINVVPKAGGPSSAVFSTNGQWLASPLMADDTSLYFITGIQTGSLMKVDKHGGTPVMVANGLATNAALTQDATDIYWASNAQVWKMSKAGGAPTLIADNQPVLTAIAVADPIIVWLAEEGELLAMPK